MKYPSFVWVWWCVLLLFAFLLQAQLQMYQRVDQCQHQGFTRTQCWQLEKNGYGK